MNEELRIGRRGLLLGGAALAAGALSSTGIATPAVATPTVATPAVGGPANPYADPLRSALDELCTLGAVGAAGQVSYGHRDTVVRSGSGNRATGTPMPAAGHFRIGSNTKTFVAVAALQLVSEGRLSLDAPVERYLPGVVSGNGNDGRTVTIHNLMQHTSGIPNYTNDLAAINSAEGFARHHLDHYEAADLVAMAMNRPPEFVAGTHWDYSNTNYILLGMVIQRLTGESWSRQVTRRILYPLRLRDTSYPADHPAIPSPASVAYQQFSPGEPFTDVSRFNATAANSAGGMVSTTADLVRFWRALQRGDLLRPAEYAAMHDTVLAETFQSAFPGVRYGLGIFWVPTAGGGYWGHPGDIPGTSTVNAVTANGDKAAVIYRNTGFADDTVTSAVETVSFGLMADLMTN